LQLDQWNRLQRFTPQSENVIQEDDNNNDGSNLFDNLDEEEYEIHSSDELNELGDVDDNMDTNSDMTPPENIILSLPSRWNMEHPYRDIELKLRIKQAAASLSSLRDLIADKSFQYSHVIRVAPRKGIKTRGRLAIAHLNIRIGYHCRVYNRCRAAMEKLNANENTLKTYQVLQRQDIRSSTALLNPNEPGSTSHRLSWIWQSALPSTETSSESLRECETLFTSLNGIPHILIM
jgi:hypothetical protein